MPPPAASARAPGPRRGGVFFDARRRPCLPASAAMPDAGLASADTMETDVADVGVAEAVADRVLDVTPPVTGPGVRVLHVDDVGPALQLVPVQLVDGRAAAAREQQRAGDGCALRPLRRAFLQEPAERGEPGAGPDHDHRDVRVLRRPERDRRLADEHERRAQLRQGSEVAGADPGEGPHARSRRCAQHPGRDRAGAGVDQRRGRDRVVPRPQRRQHVEELGERERAGRELLEQVEH